MSAPAARYVRTVIRRKPARVSLGGLFSLLLFGAGYLLLVEDRNARFIGLFAAGTSIAVLVGWSFLAPFVGGIEVTDDQIETITGFGGLISFRIQDLDMSRTRLTDTDLLLQPRNGEGIRLSVAKYAADDIAWLADYCGVAVREA